MLAAGGYDVFTTATDVVIADDGTTSIDPRLPPDAQLRGRIVGADGVGVSAYVAPYRRLPNGTGGHAGRAAEQRGRVVLPPRDLFILAPTGSASSTCPASTSPSAGTTSAYWPMPARSRCCPMPQSRVRFRLLRRANISGTITRPPGTTAPISVIAHRFRNDRWEAAAFAQVVPDGDARLTGLDADTYRVCVDGYDVLRTCWRAGSHVTGATDIVLATGQYRRRVDLAPGPAGFVSGTLPDVYLGAEGYPVVSAWRQTDDGWEAVAKRRVGPHWDQQQLDLRCRISPVGDLRRLRGARRTRVRHGIPQDLQRRQPVTAGRRPVRGRRRCDDERDRHRDRTGRRDPRRRFRYDVAGPGRPLRADLGRRA